MNAHHRHCALVLWALSAVGMSGGAARADDREPLGSPGQWLLDGSAGGSYQLTQTAVPANARLQFTDVVQWSGWLAPSAQLFVARDVALGGSIGIGSDYTTRDDFDLSEVSLSASPQVSFHAALGDHAFLLPELALGIAYVQRTLTFATVGGAFYEGYRFIPNRALYYALGSDLGVLQTTLFVPLAFAPTPGIFLGIGPYVRARWAWTGVLDTGGREFAVAVGIATIIGTWL